MSPLDDETLLPQEDEQEMFEHFRLVADKGQAPLRVDKFITTHQEDTSRNRVQQAIKLGYVLVNDKPAKAKDRKSTRLNSSHIATSRMPSSA